MSQREAVVGGVFSGECDVGVQWSSVGNGLLFRYRLFMELLLLKHPIATQPKYKKRKMDFSVWVFCHTFGHLI